MVLQQYLTITWKFVLLAAAFLLLAHLSLSVLLNPRCVLRILSHLSIMAPPLGLQTKARPELRFDFAQTISIFLVLNKLNTTHAKNITKLYTLKLGGVGYHFAQRFHFVCNGKLGCRFAKTSYMRFPSFFFFHKLHRNTKQ